MCLRHLFLKGPHSWKDQRQIRYTSELFGQRFVLISVLLPFQFITFILIRFSLSIATLATATAS